MTLLPSNHQHKVLSQVFGWSICWSWYPCRCLELYHRSWFCYRDYINTKCWFHQLHRFNTSWWKTSVVSKVMRPMMLELAVKMLLSFLKMLTLTWSLKHYAGVLTIHRCTAIKRVLVRICCRWNCRKQLLWQWQYHCWYAWRKRKRYATIDTKLLTSDSRFDWWWLNKALLLKTELKREGNLIYLEAVFWPCNNWYVLLGKNHLVQYFHSSVAFQLKKLNQDF